MRKSKFTQQQQLDILAKWDAGAKVDDLCREFQISSPTLYKWKRQRTVDEDETQRELKRLKEQNAHLTKLYADLSIDHKILREGYEMLKKWQAQDAKKK